MMKFFIDRKNVDLTLEIERTLGEVLSGLETWLSGSGLELSGISINGSALNSAELASAFNMPLDSIEEISLTTSTAAQLALDALSAAQQWLCAFAAADDTEKAALAQDWEKSPSASFLRERETELYRAIQSVFNGTGEDTGKELLAPVIEDRIRELENPRAEFLSLESAVTAIVERMERYALDIQMGKERQALETVGDFAVLCAKILRLIPLLRCSGIRFEELGIKESFFAELNAALKQFFSACEDSETVLSGDLAEYEVAPRIKELYDTIKTGIVLVQETS